jgi:GTP-dependent phosphoenolpyruvate carboxykinase
MSELLKVDVEEWKAELASIEEHLDFLGERLPQEMRDQLAGLTELLG